MLFRQPRYCTFCGEEYEEIHKYHTTLLMNRFVGDTFLGYKPHECGSILKRFAKLKK